MTSYTYLIVDLACVSIPMLASFYSKHAFYKEWQSFFKANTIVAVLFLIWDYFFTKAGIWGFNEQYLTGVYVGNLPIEEVLFFICIPYACVFTFFAFRFLFKNNPFHRFESILSNVIIVFTLVMGCIYLDKFYTSITFIGLAIFLIFLKYKKHNLSYHYLSYFAILPFFILSNGILTGSFLIDPIVWYNDAENLNTRLFNIPVEDMFYGMLLIFMNIELYLFFNTKKTTHF